MRIAFDLDDTLIRDTYNFPLERRNFFQRIFVITGIRKGTKQLFSILKNNKHEIWIYTSSKRFCVFINLLFQIYGLKLNGIVNRKNTIIF